MKVRYIYSACTVTETQSCKILSDPWFTQGAYEGSWWQYPAVENPIETIGPVDVIYISHAHPDHYDPLFLNKYLKVYPKTRIVIPDLKNNALQRRMVFDGFAPEVVKDLTVGATRMRLWPNRNPTMPIDSAIIVVDGNEVVVNVNDNPLDDVQMAALLEVSGERRVNLLMAPYTGAGPYPQTYYFPTEEARLEAAEKKKQQFIAIFRTYMDRFNPIRALPFAGKYYLSGRLAHLNDKRGVMDPADLPAHLPKEYAERVMILADGGQAYYDLSTDTASAVRTERYSPEKLQAFLKSIEGVAFDYEKEIVPTPPRHTLPILPLLKTAVHLAKKRFRAPTVPLIAFRIFNSEAVYLLFIESEEVRRVTRAEWREEEKSHPYFVEIDLDERLLFGLLTRLYQWNNAEIGSLYFCRRVPEAYDEVFYSFLIVLHV